MPQVQRKKHSLPLRALTTQSHNNAGPTLLGVLGQYPVFDRICSFLPVASLINLSQTSSKFAAIHSSCVLPTQWNIDRQLRRFVFAIQFFERVMWKESDLDIFIGQGPGAEALEDYLCKQEGYSLSHEMKEGEYWFHTRLIKTRTFTRKRSDSSTAQVQIVQTPDLPIHAILRGFYTTVVVNIITWNKAYALYPQPSFLFHKTYLLKPICEYLGKLLTKYERRGWKSQDVLWPEDEASHGSMLQGRRLGDKYIWIIPFDTCNVDRPRTPDYVLEYSGWNIQKIDNSDDPRELAYYETHAMRFGALALKHRYVYTGNNGFWVAFVGPRMDRLSLMELHKYLHQIPQESRSQMIMDTIRSGSGLDIRCLDEELARCGIMLPGYDDEIPGWYAE